MALSEREQRLLEEMERNLYRSEADVVDTGAVQAKPSARSMIIGSLMVLLGVGALIAGVATSLIWLGVVGFLIMFGGVVLAITPNKQEIAAQRESQTASANASSKKTGFQDRFEERWDRRNRG